MSYGKLTKHRSVQCGCQWLYLWKKRRVDVPDAYEEVVFYEGYLIYTSGGYLGRLTRDNFDQVWTPLPDIRPIVDDDNHRCITWEESL